MEWIGRVGVWVDSGHEECNISLDICGEILHLGYELGVCGN